MTNAQPQTDHPFGADEALMHDDAMPIPEGYTGVFGAVTQHGVTVVVTAPDLPAMLWCHSCRKWERVQEGTPN